MKVGDFVRFKEGSYFYDTGDRILGRVINVVEGIDDSDHGAIDVVLVKADSYYLDVGEIENFVHYNWQKHLEIVDEKSPL
jgi:hypothetical protein